MYFFFTLSGMKEDVWVETFILQCINNSGMSVIWLRKQPNSVMVSSHFLAACLLISFLTAAVLQWVSLGHPLQNRFSYCFKHWSLVFIDVACQHNSGNMPAHSPNSLSVSWFAFIRLIENPAISSDVMKDPHITLATTTPRLSICIESTNQIRIYPPWTTTKNVFGCLWCLNN